MIVENWLFSGDSITEGFGDQSLAVSCYGVPGRLMRDQLLLGSSAVRTIHNVGCSGLMVPDYIRRARGNVAADPSRVTGVAVSIWSPNLPAGQPTTWPFDPVNLAAMRVALQGLEAYCLSLSKVFLPVFYTGTAFDVNSAMRINLQAHLEACLALWPFLVDLHDVVQDPAITDGPQIGDDFTGDATHPDAAGYDALHAAAVTRIPTGIAAAKSFYGFTEP